MLSRRQVLKSAIAAPLVGLVPTIIKAKPVDSIKKPIGPFESAFNAALDLAVAQNILVFDDAAPSCVLTNRLYERIVAVFGQNRFYLYIEPMLERHEKLQQPINFMCHVDIHKDYYPWWSYQTHLTLRNAKHAPNDQYFGLIEFPNPKTDIDKEGKYQGFALCSF
jgi:hypothetical protein